MTWRRKCTIPSPNYSAKQSVALIFMNETQKSLGSTSGLSARSTTRPAAWRRARGPVEKILSEQGMRIKLVVRNGFFEGPSRRPPEAKARVRQEELRRGEDRFPVGRRDRELHSQARGHGPPRREEDGERDPQGEEVSRRGTDPGAKPLARETSVSRCPRACVLCCVTVTVPDFGSADSPAGLQWVSPHRRPITRSRSASASWISEASRSG